MASQNFAKRLKTQEDPSETVPETICHSGQLDIICSGLNNLRTGADRSSCDVFVMCGDRKFPAHRVILRAGSAYFDAMFTSGLKEATSSEVSLPTISENSMAVILDFLYLQPVNVGILPADEILDLLSATHLLQVCPVIDMCVDELLKKISVDNWDVVLQEAVTFSIDCVISATVQIFSENKNLIGDEKLQKLGFDSFNTLISSLSKGSYKSADVLLNLIVNWVTYEADREKYLLGLLSSIEISSVSKDVLINLINDNCLIGKSLELSYFLLKKISANFNDSLTLKTASCNPKLVIFTTSSIQSFDLLKEEWFNHNLVGNTVPEETYSMALAVADHGIYFTADVQDKVLYRRREKMTIIAFYPAINSAAVITTCTRLQKFAMIYLNDTLYMTGGGVFDGVTFTRDLYLKCLHLQSNMWKILAQPILFRDFPRVVVVCGKIYVLGGWKGQNLIRDVEKYCPTTNQWTLISPVPDPTSNYFNFNTVPFLSKIYLSVNTYDIPDKIYHTELAEFDTETNSWKDVTKEFKQKLKNTTGKWIIYGSSKPLPFLVIEQDDKYYKMDPRTQHCTLITEKPDYADNSNLVVFA